MALTFVSSLCWLAGDVKEPAQFLQKKKGNLAASAVVWPCSQKIPKLGAPVMFSFKNRKLLNTV